ncbi:hypothetical protein M5689_025158 [Euphorbia peplus]|nr:hypothetical protein M5689_025158 [Euphorbia peplus]
MGLCYECVPKISNVPSGSPLETPSVVFKMSVLRVSVLELPGNIECSCGESTMSLLGLHFFHLMNSMRSSSFWTRQPQ